jgi:hypothetical protein
MSAGRLPFATVLDFAIEVADPKVSSKVMAPL